MSIKGFLRFLDESGNTVYGELSSSALSGDLEGASVSILSGNPFDGLSRTDKQATIKKVKFTATSPVSR
jgi:hypothetical protein